MNNSPKRYKQNKRKPSFGWLDFIFKNRKLKTIVLVCSIIGVFNLYGLNSPPLGA